MLRRIVFDIESTGLSWKSGDKIIEIAAVELDGTRITGRQYNERINPKVRISDGAFRVHGISNEDLLDKPLFKDIASDFIEFIGDAELIAHNAPFDAGFVNNELSMNGMEPLSNQITDTLAMAKMQRPGKRNTLDALQQHFKLQTTRTEGTHGALIDCILLAKVYSCLKQGERSSGFDLPQALMEIRKIEVAPGQLIVMRANEEELTAHAKMCAALNIKEF